MTNLRPIFLTIALTTASVGSYAQTPEQQNEHHPKISAEEQTSSDKSVPVKMRVYDHQMSAMDRQMKAMREMHDKMTRAKTPEARQELMAEHMKVLKGVMGMMAKGMGSDSGGVKGKKEMMSMHGVNHGMGRIHGGETESDHLMQRNQMMGKRMEMMQSMMHLNRSLRNMALSLVAA